jgi:hypothetical protein
MIRHTPVKLKWKPGNKDRAPQSATTELLAAGVAQWVRFFEIDGKKSLLRMLGQSHTRHVKNFLK